MPRDGNLLGRVIDTFVAAQIRPELTVASSRPRWYHLREKGGRHEVDLVIEFRCRTGRWHREQGWRRPEPQRCSSPGVAASGVG